MYNVPKGYVAVLEIGHRVFFVFQTADGGFFFYSLSLQMRHELSANNFYKLRTCNNPIDSVHSSCFCDVNDRLVVTLCMFSYIASFACSHSTTHRVLFIDLTSVKIEHTFGKWNTDWLLDIVVVTRYRSFLTVKTKRLFFIFII